MSVKTFKGANTREAMAEVRRALGEDAVVLSTRKVSDGVEVMAASHDGLNSMTGSEPVLTQAQRNARRADESVRQQLASRNASAPGEPMPFMQFLAGQPNVMAPTSAVTLSASGTSATSGAPAVVRNPRAALQMPEPQRVVVASRTNPAARADTVRDMPAKPSSAMPAMNALDEDGLADHIGDRVGDVMGELMG
jgi:flagellar biosynthesis GTPase FlhF